MGEGKKEGVTPPPHFTTPEGRLSFPQLRRPGSAHPTGKYLATAGSVIAQSEDAHRKALEYVRRLATEGIHPVGDGVLSDCYEMTAEQFATAERIWKEIFH